MGWSKIGREGVLIVIYRYTIYPSSKGRKGDEEHDREIGRVFEGKRARVKHKQKQIVRGRE